MGRPSETSDQTIIDAGCRLLDAGVKISRYSLRKAVGSGDAKRIEAVWLAHVAAEAPASEEPLPEVPLPPGLQDQRDAAVAQVSDVMARLFASSWQAAHDIAQRRLGDEQAVMRDRKIAVEQQLVSADDLIEDMENEAAVAAQRTIGIAVAADEARMDAVRAAERHDVVQKAAREAADLAVTTVAGLQADLTAAGTAVTGARHDADIALATAAAVHAEAERLRNEVAVQRLELTQVQSDKADLMARLAAMDAQATAVKEELERERHTRVAVDQKVADMSERAARAEQRASSAEHQGLQIEEKIRLLEVANGKLRSEVEELTRVAQAG
jgi:flagellar biosynthesis GTPase FlhF